MPDWVGVGGLISGLVAALVAGWSAYRSQRVGELERVCDRQERHIVQIQAALGAQQSQLDICQQDRADERVETTETRGWLRIFRDGWVREVRARLGDLSDVPDLPPPKRTPEELERREFEWRTHAQTARLLQEADPSGKRSERP